jgi:colicin import membrane protein
MLATAVAAAVTTPVLLLSAGTAFAAGPTTPAQVQDQKAKPTEAELKKLAQAAVDAQKVYDDALAAHKAVTAEVETVMSDTSPLQLKVDETKAAADAAATAKTTADEKLTEARTALEKLLQDETATEEAKNAAQKAVTDAQTAATGAATAKETADQAHQAAMKTRDDARVEVLRKLHTAKGALDSAKAAKDLADKALKAAQDEAAKPDPTKPPVDPTTPPVDPTTPPVDPTKPPVDPTEPGEDECVYDNSLTTTLNGLPSKVVAGTTVNFTLRVTNGTGKELDEVQPFAAVFADPRSGHGDVDSLLRLQAAAAGSNSFKDVEQATYAGTITHLKDGASADLKLRLIVDAKAPAADGYGFVAGDYWNNDGSCGGNDLKEYNFSILAAGSKPDKVTDSTPGKVKDTTKVTLPQGGASATPITTDASGNLAATGSSGTSQIALAAGAAVALGAGAVFVVRRRKADHQA